MFHPPHCLADLLYLFCTKLCKTEHIKILNSQTIISCFVQQAQRAHGAGVTDLEVYSMLAKLRQEPSFLFGQIYKVPLPHSDIIAYVRQVCLSLS